jgi:hypothetical protein
MTNHPWCLGQKRFRAAGRRERPCLPILSNCFDQGDESCILGGRDRKGKNPRFWGRTLPGARAMKMSSTELPKGGVIDLSSFYR